MTLDQACGVTNPDGIAWKEKFDRYIAHIGQENIKKHLPADVPELARQWLRDEHFNGMPLKVWQDAAGYAGFRDSQSSEPPKASGPFPRLLTSKGVTCFSMSEAISLLKHCAEKEARAYLKQAVSGHAPETGVLEIWAVFETCQARPDAMNRHNIFDYDCIASFRDEKDAIACELENPGRRVRKLVRYQYAAEKKGGAADAVR